MYEDLRSLNSGTFPILNFSSFLSQEKWHLSHTHIHTKKRNNEFKKVMSDSSSVWNRVRSKLMALTSLSLPKYLPYLPYFVTEAG